MSASRILAASAAVLLTTSVVITLAGGWRSILGQGLQQDTGPITAALCLGMIAVTMPIGMGQRVLAGLGKNHVTVLIVGLQTPIVLVALLLVINLDLPAGPYIAVIPYLATFLLSVVCTVLSARMLRPNYWQAVRDAFRIKTVRGGPVFHVAWPMLIQMIALPVAMQTDRLILSHVAGSDDLARYNIASQIYTPVWQVVSAAGFALWPIYARARATKTATTPFPLAWAFAGTAAAVCVGLSIAAPFLTKVATDGRIHLNLTIMVVFSVFMIVQAAKYPLGMYMTSSEGLRYQALMILIMSPINIGISLVLARHLGTPGPIIGSIVGVSIFQLGANIVYVRRNLAASARPEPLASLPD